MRMMEKENWYMRFLGKRSGTPENEQVCLSKKQYKEMFKDEQAERRALRLALDIRKFEIELYWKRATYFWAFIGSAFAGLAVISAAKDIHIDVKQDFEVLFSCLGFVFSWGWFCVNKGSKLWQENWENHIDLLEDGYVGKLYKVILKRPKEQQWLTVGKVKEVTVGPHPYSVSRINQLISLYVSIVWTYLLIVSLNINMKGEIRVRYCVLATASLIVVVCFKLLCVSHYKKHNPIAIERKTEIMDKKLE